MVNGEIGFERLVVVSDTIQWSICVVIHLSYFNKPTNYQKDLFFEKLRNPGAAKKAIMTTYTGVQK
jgi:hypothetical protein